MGVHWRKTRMWSIQTAVIELRRPATLGLIAATVALAVEVYLIARMIILGHLPPLY